MKRNNHEKMKILVIGADRVGKTQCCNRLSGVSFKHAYIETIGVDFINKTYQPEGQEKIQFQFWDTSGAERFSSVVQAYYRSANVAFVFDITDRKSFTKLSGLIKKVDSSVGSKKLMLIGNKSDGVERQVTTEEAKIFAEENGMKYFEVSAKNDTGFVPILNYAALKFQESRKQNEELLKVGNLNTENSSHALILKAALIAFILLAIGAAATLIAIHLPEAISAFKALKEIVVPTASVFVGLSVFGVFCTSAAICKKNNDFSADNLELSSHSNNS